MKDACRSFCYKLKILLKKLLAFLFSHVGLCGLVAGWAVLGMFLFHELEYPYELKNHGHVEADTKKVVDDLWDFVMTRPTLVESEIKAEADRLFKQYEHVMVKAVNFEGYDERDETDRPTYQWTLSGSLLYSITVFTTIGYGHICPKTVLGRVMTMVYSMIGIPLMLLCLANIAETLARIFTFIYFKVCCLYCRWSRNRRRKKRAALSLRYHYVAGQHGSLKRGQSLRRGQSTMRQPGGPYTKMSTASVPRGRGLAPPIDTRSIRSGRSAGQSSAGGSGGPRYEHSRWDTVSLPPNRHPGTNLHQQQLTRKVSGERIRSGVSPRGSTRHSPYYHHSGGGGGAAVLPKLAEKRPRQPPLSLATQQVQQPQLEQRSSGASARSVSEPRPPSQTNPYGLPIKKHRPTACPAWCRCCHRGEHTPGSQSPYGSMHGGVPVRYVNSNESKTSAVIELKSFTGQTGSFGGIVATGGTAPQHRGPMKHSRSSESTGLKHSGSTNSAREEEHKAIPQITVSDNEKDGQETSGHATTTEDEDEYTDEEESSPGQANPPPQSSQQPPPLQTRAYQTTMHHTLSDAGETQMTIISAEGTSSKSMRSDRSEEVSMRSFRKSGYSKKEKMPVSVGIITVVVFILGGAILFSYWEGWHYFDGAYYSFITLSTIGFGDIVPGNSLGDDGGQDKLIICSLYLLFGMALIAMCFKLMQDDVVQKARWLGQKIGLLVKEDSSESESEYEEEIGMEEEEDEMSEEKTTEDKRTVSSGSSKGRGEEDDYQPHRSYELPPLPPPPGGVPSTSSSHYLQRLPKRYQSSHRRA